MRLFNFQKQEDISTLKTHYRVDYSAEQLLDAMDTAVLREVVHAISAKIVKQIYPEVIKALDKELIVKEVSTKVSQEILEGIYGKLREKK